jgi:site-specific recombinase XerD
VKVGHITFEMLNFDLLTNFFDWLTTTRKNSRTTAKQRMGALSSFAEYAQNRNLEAGYVFRSSLAKISKKSFRNVKGKQRCSFTRAELKILFSLPDTSGKIGWRNLVLLSVMYSSGSRAQEICDITVKHVAHDEKGNAILTLTGKGEKTRRVKITTDATELLDKYISYRKIGNQPDRYIFSSQRNEHMSVACIEEIFSKYVILAKERYPNRFCAGRYTPHVMRHTTATHLVDAGVPLAIVKNILGHSSIQTTQVYVEISQQTVDRYMKDWNKKWFPNDKTNEEILPKINNSMPDFLM